MSGSASGRNWWYFIIPGNYSLTRINEKDLSFEPYLPTPFARCNRRDSHAIDSHKKGLWDSSLRRTHRLDRRGVRQAENVTRTLDIVNWAMPIIQSSGSRQQQTNSETGLEVIMTVIATTLVRHMLEEGQK